MKFILFLYAFFVDIVFCFSRLLRGESVSSLKKKCGREREEKKNYLGTWKECFYTSE